MSSNAIQNRQNEQTQLKILYASRVYFDSAEILNYCVWILCFISALSIFIPDEWPMLISYAIPFFADILAAVGMMLVNWKVQVAAKVRNYFDAYVLNINLNQFSESDVREIKEIAEKTYLKNMKKAEIQMKNTGSDNPPGVYDWYVFPKPCADIIAQFECQQQNAWWDKKMSSFRLTMATIGVFAVGGTFLYLVFNSGNMLCTLLCTAGIALKIVERFIENGKYVYISIQIEGSQKIVEARPEKEHIEAFQNLISKRRTIVVLGVNLLHKKFAAFYTKLYEKRLK